MMREIKFRVYCTGHSNSELKGMHYPDEPPYGDYLEGWTQTICLLLAESMAGNWGADELSEECTLMQYTGLKDKNGVEIYEGDIVHFEDVNGEFYYNNEVFFNMDITLSTLEWGLQNDKGYMSLDIGKYEVIGNIHEE